MPSDYTLGAADIRRACGIGYRATHTLVNKPFPIPFKSAARGPKGGNAMHAYRLSDLLPRMRAKRRYTSEMECELCRIDYEIRQNNEGNNHE